MSGGSGPALLLDRNGGNVFLPSTAFHRKLKTHESVVAQLFTPSMLRIQLVGDANRPKLAASMVPFSSSCTLSITRSLIIENVK